MWNLETICFSFQSNYPDNLCVFTCHHRWAIVAWAQLWHNLIFILYQSLTYDFLAKVRKSHMGPTWFIIKRIHLWAKILSTSYCPLFGMACHLMGISSYGRIKPVYNWAESRFWVFLAMKIVPCWENDRQTCVINRAVPKKLIQLRAWS